MGSKPACRRKQSGRVSKKHSTTSTKRSRSSKPSSSTCIRQRRATKAETHWQSRKVGRAWCATGTSRTTRGSWGSWSLRVCLLGVRVLLGLGVTISSSSRARSTSRCFWILGTIVRIGVVWRGTRVTSRATRGRSRTREEWMMMIFMHLLMIILTLLRGMTFILIDGYLNLIISWPNH